MPSRVLAVQVVPGEVFELRCNARVGDVVWEVNGAQHIEKRPLRIYTADGPKDV